MSGFVNDLSQLQKGELIKFNEYLDENVETIKKEIETKLNTIPTTNNEESSPSPSTSTPIKITELKIWNINLEKLSNQRDIILLKFLRARDFKFEMAKQMLIESLVWRKQFNVENILNEEFPEFYKEIGEIWSKPDKEGRPIMVNYYHKINPDVVFKDGVNQFLRWKVQQMERSIVDTLIPSNWQIEDLVVIHDYKDVSFFKSDSRIRAASNQVITTLQNNYPEFLAKKFFINIPWLLEKMAAIYSALTSERTKSKFVVCSGTYREKLIKFIDIDNIPQRLGGFEDNGQPIQSVKIESQKNHIIDLSKLDTDKTIEWEYTSLQYQKDLSSQIISSINGSGSSGNITIEGTASPSPSSSPTTSGQSSSSNNILLSIKPKDFNSGSIQIEDDGYYKFVIKNHFQEAIDVHYRISTKSRLTQSVNNLSKNLENTKLDKSNEIVNQLDKENKENLDQKEKEKLENDHIALI